MSESDVYNDSDDDILSDVNDDDSPPSRRNKLKNMDATWVNLEWLRSKRKLLQCKLNYADKRGPKTTRELKYLQMFLDDLHNTIQNTSTVLGRKPYGVDVHAD